MPTPSLTVILPAHNAEKTISAAIASTLNQTYTDFDLWILENGSTDRTAEIARTFTDPRVKVFELGSVGFQGAIQYAIENASSDWLARMDADDLMFPNRLKRQMEVIRQRPELVLVGTAWALLTPLGHIFEQRSFEPSREVDGSRLNQGRFFADPSTIFNRRVALEIGGVDPEFSIGDVPLWFRLLSRGQGWEIAEPLYLYRIQPDSMSKKLESSRQGLRARAKYFSQGPQAFGEMEPQPFSVWYYVGLVELSGGNGTAARSAAQFLASESPKAARRMRWISRLGRFGYLLYRLRYRSRHSYRRRLDWEQLFRPLLA